MVCYVFQKFGFISEAILAAIKKITITGTATIKK